MRAIPAAILTAALTGAMLGLAAPSAHAWDLQHQYNINGHTDACSATDVCVVVPTICLVDVCTKPEEWCFIYGEDTPPVICIPMLSKSDTEMVFPEIATTD